MDDRIKRALELIEEWDSNKNPSGHNDINTLYELREILSENPKEVPQYSLYRDAILKLAPEYDPRHVEAYIRLEHGTLDALSREQFSREVRISCACIDTAGIKAAEDLALSFGFFPPGKGTISESERTFPDEEEHSFGPS